MEYKCINPFFSNSLSHGFHYGDKISSAKYSALPHNEKVNFSEESYGDNNSYSTGTSDDYVPPITIDYGLNDSPSIDLGSSDSGSSNFDFGGGDGGGGGATGDW